MKAIINTKIVLPDSIIMDGTLLYDERIVDFGETGEVEIPAGAQIIDAKGKYTIPGFIDTHVHGCGSTQFKDDVPAVTAHFLDHGTTTIMASLAYGDDFDTYMRGIDYIREESKRGTGRTIGGMYMEGPYMNPAFGASASGNKWKGKINPDEYRPIVDKAADFVRVWCIDPAREGIEEFCKYARKVNPSVRFAMGHCECKYEDMEKLKKYGLCDQVHHTNATGIVHRLDPINQSGIRDSGPDEACWYDDDIYAELISDEYGVHVAPFMLRMIAKIKGMDKIILITDSSVSDGAKPSAKYAKITDIGFDEEGGVSGSKIAMDGACHNFMKHTGYGICHVSRFASGNPAKMLGLYDEVGSIAVGKRANLLISDDVFNIEHVIFGGDTVR